MAFEGLSAGHEIDEGKLVGCVGLELFDDPGEFGGVDLWGSLGVIALFAVAGGGVLAALGGCGSAGVASVGAGGGDASGGMRGAWAWLVLKRGRLRMTCLARLLGPGLAIP